MADVMFVPVDRLSGRIGWEQGSGWEHWATGMVVVRTDYRFVE